MRQVVKIEARWGLLALVLLGLVTLTGTAEAQPNVILIMVDDLSPGDHPDDPDAANIYLDIFNGTGEYPNIASIAEGGMRFRTMYATPVCTASRVELLTGQYGFNNGYYYLHNDSYSPLPTSPFYDMGAKQSIARILRAKGYRTGVVGKWKINGDPELGLIYEMGFEDYYVFGNVSGTQQSRYWAPTILDNGVPYVGTSEEFGPDLFANWAVDFIEDSANANEKFFLYYPMALIHVINKVEGYVDVPDGSGGTIAGSLKSNVEYVDHIVGRILTAVSSAGLDDETLIIFTADNGTNYNHYKDVSDPANPIPWSVDYPGFKNNPKENGARVPFLVRYTGVIWPGVVSRQVTDFVDIAATIHDYTGDFSIPRCEPTFDGASLRPVLEDNSQTGKILPLESHKGCAFVNNGEGTCIFSYLQDKRIIRDDQWVYQDVDENGEGELYFCGNARSILKCFLQVEPLSPDAAAKKSEFMQALLSYPLPDVLGQQLYP